MDMDQAEVPSRYAGETEAEWQRLTDEIKTHPLDGQSQDVGIKVRSISLIRW